MREKKLTVTGNKFVVFLIIKCWLIFTLTYSLWTHWSIYSLPLQTQVINQTTSEGTCRHCRTLANKRPAKTIRTVKKLKRKQLFTCSEQPSVQLGVIIKRFHAVKDGIKAVTF